MKRILLLLALLSTTLIGFARNVEIHLTDMRGTSLPGMTIDFLGDRYETDEEGKFTIQGLTSGGTFSFHYSGKNTSGDISFEWNGGSPSVEVKIPTYLITLRLSGLTEEEMEWCGNMRIYLGEDKNSYSSYFFSDGVLTTCWEHSTLYWRFYADVFGTTDSEIIDLNTTTGDILVDPKAGKTHVMVGNVIGKDGQPLTDYRINGIHITDPTNEKLSWWAKYGEHNYDFKAKDYYGFNEEYTASGEEMTIDIDLRDHVAVNVEVTDRDGSALALAALLRAGEKDTLGVTDQEGKYTFYAKPGSDLWLQMSRPMYGVREIEAYVKGKDITLPVSYEGFVLISTKILGGANYIQPRGDYWSQNAEVELKEPDSEEGEYLNHIYELSYEKQGDDILVSTMVDNSKGEWSEARMNLTFSNAEPHLLPVEGTFAPLTGDIINEYDVRNHVPVTLKAPEGFQFNGQEIKVDGQEIMIGWDERSNGEVVVYMPQGEHSWTPALTDKETYQDYPYGKEQAFTVGAEGATSVYQFDINNYSSVRFTVTDREGKPWRNMAIRVKKENESWYDCDTYTYTDENGVATIFLSEPGKYNWLTDYSFNKTLRRQSGEITVGESMVDVAVSYEGWRQLTMKVTGADLADKYTQPSFIHGSNVNEHLWEGNDYTLSYLVPTDQNIDGYIELTAKKDQKRGIFPVRYEAGSEDVIYTLCTDNIHTVTFTTSGKPLEFAGYGETVYVYQDNQRLSDYELEGGTLLTAGKYTAVYSNYLYGHKDTVDFEMADQDMVVDFDFNPDNYHGISFSAADADEVWFYVRGYEDNAFFLNGTYSYEVTYIVKNGVRYKTSISGTVEVKDQDAEVVLDLSDYRFLTLNLKEEDGSSLPSEQYHDIKITSDKMGVMYSNVRGNEPLCLMILPGTYNIEVEINESYSNKRYGQLVVTADSPEVDDVVLTKEKPDGIGDVAADGTDDPTAILTQGGMLISSTSCAPVMVDIYTLQGQRVLTTQAMPGTTLPTRSMRQGIHLVRMSQAGKQRTQKVVIK